MAGTTTAAIVCAVLAIFVAIAAVIIAIFAYNAKPVGPQGPIGPTGPQGQNGQNGATGPTGSVGPTGPINQAAFPPWTTQKIFQNSTSETITPQLNYFYTNVDAPSGQGNTNLTINPASPGTQFIINNFFNNSILYYTSSTTWYFWNANITPGSGYLLHGTYLFIQLDAQSGVVLPAGPKALLPSD